MPNTTDSANPDTAAPARKKKAASLAGRAAGLVRANPRKAIAAGAAMAAGVAGAAVLGVKRRKSTKKAAPKSAAAPKAAPKSAAAPKAAPAKAPARKRAPAKKKAPKKS